MSESEQNDATTPQPEGKVTMMIRQDAALRLLERSQKDHTDLQRAHNQDLRDDVQRGFKRQNWILAAFMFLYLVQTLIFAALIGTSSKVEVPETLGGGSIEINAPAPTPTKAAPED